ncbi:MAG: DUF4256 domain-containing protein [Bacteroidota bacterium]
MAIDDPKDLSPETVTHLLSALQQRFESNLNRHPGLLWKDVFAKLEGRMVKLRSLYEMEQTGGDPDVTAYDPLTREFIFTDCSEESPKGRRSLCYDQVALDARKENKPAGSACDMARRMGIDLLDEAQYRDLQKLGAFDLKTSSWIKTPADVRTLGGALFCDRRYNTVFVYHNGAESYYAARGFRGSLRV